MAAKQAAPKSNKPPPIVTRGLSINEPWAWAIVNGPKTGRGWKPIENRTWPTSFVGTVAVQASTAKRHLNEETVALLYGADSRIIPRIDNEHIDDENQIFHLGAIIGVVDIVGCIEFNPADDGPADFEKRVRAAGLSWWLDKHQGDWDAAAAGQLFKGDSWSSDAVYWAEGPYCFLLDNPRQFTQPIAARGKLNIYRLEPAEIQAVARALAAPLGCPVEYRAKLKAAKGAAAAAINGSKARKQPAAAGK